MKTSRQEFLRAIRDRVQNDPLRAESHPVIVPPPENTTELVTQFRAALERTGGKAYLAADAPQARTILAEIIQEANPQRILWVDSSALTALDLPALEGAWEKLNLTQNTRSLGEIIKPEDLSITGADFAIAETGTLLVYARPDQPRLLSALPAIHIAVVRTSQLVPTLAELMPTLRERVHEVSNITLITGPSRSGDIEQTLTIGAHGPRAVHVILIAS